MITFKHEKNISRRLNNGMEIDLGVNVKRSARDLTFISVESETVLVLLGHLPGYMQDKIETSINEVRQEICISGVGDKASLDMAIGGRLRLKNELETNSFEKVFGIPNGVALDQIEVCFNEEDAILMILMPKSINIEGEVDETGTQEIGKEDEALVDEDELNRNGLVTNTHQEGDEETKNEEVDESNKKIEALNVGEQLLPSFGVKPKGEQQIEETHNGQPLKEDESSETSEVEQALDQPKISQNIDKEQEEEQEKQEDKKGSVGESHDIKEEDEEQVHELDNKPIYEKGLPQQLIDKLPMEEVKGKGREMEKGEVGGRETQEIDKERVTSEVNQTLGRPKISQNIDKEEEEEEEDKKHEDMKRDVGKSQGIKEEDKEQIHEPNNKAMDNKGLPQQLIQELETSKKDELSTKEMKGKRRKEQGGLGVPPPSLAVSAFLLSLAALIIKLVRNQKRT
ncbi:uncharacterized protein LOC141847953 [Curcuma longa]|uniref:uncharacterized protein LOC141847953 n=1 Tax=Curcuma longa TaxID=136217 RepID=UPI003D9E8B9D